MEHAGRAVIFSGIAVAIGLLALVVLPVPFLRSIGYGGLLIPLISVLVAITLLPVILATIGPRLDRIGLPPPHRERRPGLGARGAASSSGTAGSSAALALVILAALFVPGPRTSRPARRAPTRWRASGHGPRGRSTRSQSSGIGRRGAEPLRRGRRGRRPRRDGASGRRRWRACAARSRPAGGQWRRGDTAIVNVFPDEEDDASNVQAVREAVRRRATARCWWAAARPGCVDFNEAVYGNFIWVVLVILLITYILLARVFRSLLLPLKAIVFNIISIGAVWGFMVFFWQEGNGSERALRHRTHRRRSPSGSR